MARETEKRLIVLMTAGSESEAVAIARTLVDERLAACCSMMPRIRSVYRWQGEVHDEAEVLMIAKTTSARLDALTRRAIEIHSYECPEVVAVEIGGGSPAYLNWLSAQCAGGREQADAT